MTEISPSRAHWAPESESDRQLVLKALDSILSSYHFRGSKRYPALLRYVVAAALDGRIADLKERTLGVEVFGRNPDYDTSADPVVRFSAGEVRKRIAQYYHENGHGVEVQIELPLGSYAPEFRLLRENTAAGEQADLLSPQSGSRRGIGRRAIWIAGIGVAALLAVAGIFWVRSGRGSESKKDSVSDKVWNPLVNSTRPILIVVGTSHPIKLGPEPDNTSFIDHMTGPYHHVSIATAVALANLAGVLRQRGAAYEIKEDVETSLTDLRSRPVILVGATNNSWTMRLLTPLRFHFVRGPRAKVLDSKDPANPQWLIDFTKPYWTIGTDYAVMARYYDTTTEGPVMVIAGLGPYGTEAASSFAGSAEYLQQIPRHVAPGWENKNLEVVLKTEVLDGKPGPPVLISSQTW